MKKRLNPEERKAIQEKRAVQRYARQVKEQKRGRDDERLNRYERIL